MNSSCLARRSSDHQSMDPDIYQIHTKAAGPTGKLPVTEDCSTARAVISSE
jgi:hypothetical protein